ncbi:hypothetical protein K456DRAFT_1720467 [Colletotrichum gloeosporioides 23]|nr:hypothetical protein K456DRAFT_1720467 [Colletotrichum gloeosporioides 23]
MCALRPGTGSQRIGLSRDLSKIPLDLRQELEGIEVLHDIRDQRAIERAVSGVDAVVSAVAAVPGMITETQLLLLRAAETAVVKYTHRYADTTLADAWDVWEDWDIGKLKKLSLDALHFPMIPKFQ